MAYVIETMTEVIFSRIIDNSIGHPYIKMSFETACRESERPEGFVLDRGRDSYLVIIPFPTRNPASFGDYAFFFNGKMNHIQFTRPFYNNFLVQEREGVYVTPNDELIDGLTEAFEAHHSVVRVVDGVPTPRGGLVVPRIENGAL